MYKNISSLFEILNHPSNRNSKIKAFLRLLWWKVNQYLFKIPVVINLTDGVKCICYPESSFGGLVVYKKLPEYYEMKFILNYLEPGDTFIDIGANLGEMSLLAASKIGSTGQVFAFEPDKNVLSKLIENINLNDLSKIIKVISAVVSDSTSHIKFTQEKASEISHIAYIKTRVGRGSDLVVSTTLKKFINDYKIKNIKMVKIDVEGAEMKVLMGARNVIDKVACIVIELNKNSEKYGYKSTEPLKFLKDNGFETYMFGKMGKLIKTTSEVNPDPAINILAIRKVYLSK